MKLMSLTMLPIHGIPKQVRRLIGVGGSADSLTQLSEIVSREGEDAQNDLDFKSVLSDVVGFSDDPTRVETPLINVADASERKSKKIVSMEYNKDTGCFNFVLTVCESPVNASRRQEVHFTVSGYTSRADSTLSGLLPDDMVFYINELYGSRITYTYNALGELVPNYDTYTILDNVVLSQAVHASEQGYVEQSVNLIDLAKSANIGKSLLNSVTGEKDEDLSLDPNNTIYAPTANNTPRLLDTHLKNPVNFIHAITGSQLNYLAESEYAEPNSTNSFFANGDGSSIEGSISRIGLVKTYSQYGFIKALKSAVAAKHGGSGYGLASDPSFTLGELRVALMNPTELDAAIREATTRSWSMGGMLTENTDDWVGHNNMSTRGSLIAYEISMRISQIMATNHIAEFRMVYDNREADTVTKAKLSVLPESVRTSGNRVLPEALARRFYRMLEETLLDVSKHNRIRFNMTMICVLGTVNRVEITMDGSHRREYFTFASMFDSRLHFGNTLSSSYTINLIDETAKLMKAVEMGFDSHANKNGRSNISLSPFGVEPLEGLTPSQSLNAPQTASSISTGDSLEDFRKMVGLK